MQIKKELVLKAKANGITYAALQNRLKGGMDVDQATTRPMKKTRLALGPPQKQAKAKGHNLAEMEARARALGVTYGIYMAMMAGRIPWPKEAYEFKAK